MKLLTIDTSTTACSVALSRDGELIAEYLVNQGGTLTSRILSSVDAVLRGAGLTMNDLDGLGVALGPGSFTGLRVGIATVKGLALAAKKPVAGFSSLAMLAMNLPWATHQVCPMFDARKKEVYAGLYECRDRPLPLVPDGVASPAEFLDKITGPAIFIGEGAARYRDLISARLGEKALFAPSSVHLPRASAGALLAADAFDRGETVPLALLLPAYIRPSEAELAKINSLSS